MQVNGPCTKGLTIARSSAILFACFVTFGAQVFAGDIYGTVTATTDGVVQVAGTRINLHGIVMPTPKQKCIANDIEWDCGRGAFQALVDRVGVTPIRCVAHTDDNVDGIAAVCYLGSIDINAWLVSEGWALASQPFTLAYLEAEQAARFSEKGIWRGGFNAPPSWRRQQQGLPANEDGIGCTDCAQRHRSFLKSRANGADAN